ncbi:MAG: hypothetical protein KIT83_10260 [Bryobacterales bacterium]|nr:hypothetical protein [Bryobacterales bacterium]
MKISLPNPAQMLDVATKIAGPLLGGPIGAALSAAMKLGQSSSDLKSALSKLSSSLQSSQPKMGSQVASQPQPFNSININITITQDPIKAATQSLNQRFAMPPMVGNDSQWPSFAQAANSRITGNSQGLFDGTNPWTKNDGRTEERAAVGWVMQQNDSLRYDADSKKFYTTAADGTRTDKLSLDQVVNTIRANGGANSNAAGLSAVGKLANDAANSPGPAKAQQNSLQPLMDMLRQFSELLGKLSKGAQESFGNLSSLASGGAMGSFSGGVAGGAIGSAGASGLGSGSGSISGGGPGASSAASAAGTGGSGSGSASGGAGASQGSSGGGNIDSMMSQAEGLLRSDKMEDQLKGQKMMQQALRMFELLSKLIEKQGEMQSKAIAAIK